MIHVRIWINSCRRSFCLNLLLSECLEDSLEHSWLQNPKRGVSRRVSAACAPVSQRRSSHCSWAHLQNAFPRPPTQVLYIHPAPPAQRADTLTFKSLRRGHLKSDASFKMQAVTSPQATCQSYAALQQADVQPANRIAGGMCRCERCPGGAQSGRSRCWGKKHLWS